MNRSEYLINRITREIPPEILKRAFYTDTALSIMRPSIRHTITSVVLEGWLYKDCNVVGGIESNIDLHNSKMRNVERGMILEIPMSATGGREITSVLSLSYGYGSMGGGNQIVNAVVGPLLVSDVRISLVGKNVIFAEGGLLSGFSSLRCILDNNEGFTNVSQRALPLLGDMAVLATKAYIYNNLTIKIAKSEIYGGTELGRFGEIVSDYSDSITMYNELLTTQWGKASIMMDRTANNRLIRMMMPR